MRTRNVIPFRELQQSGERLVSLVEDDRILFRRFSRVKQFNLHLGSFTHWDGLRRRDIFACRLPRMPSRGGDPRQRQYLT